MSSRFLKLLLSALFVCTMVLADAAVTVKGVVLDGAGEPIIGANVLVKGSTTGTITDFDGNWQLEVADLSVVLQFSYIGMKTQEMPARDANGYADRGGLQTLGGYNRSQWRATQQLGPHAGAVYLQRRAVSALR